MDRFTKHQLFSVRVVRQQLNALSVDQLSKKDLKQSYTFIVQRISLSLFFLFFYRLMTSCSNFRHVMTRPVKHSKLYYWTSYFFENGLKNWPIVVNNLKWSDSGWETAKVVLTPTLAPESSPGLKLAMKQGFWLKCPEAKIKIWLWRIEKKSPIFEAIQKWLSWQITVKVWFFCTRWQNKS